MPLLRILLSAVLCFTLFAQEAQTPATDNPDFRIVATVDNVTTPALVTDRDGGWVHGLQPQQFHLYDNDKEQNIKVDVTYVPISLCIVVEKSSRVEGVMNQVKKLGSLIQPLVIGEQGEAALIAYDHRVQVLQDWTTDANKIQEAANKITVGSMSSRMVDAVYEGARLLRSRPTNRRRIMLLVGETRDFGSAGRLRETLITLQINNVVFYAVDVSRFVTTLTQKGPTPRPDNREPASRPMPPGVPATPNTVMQMYGTQGGRAEFLPLMIEILRDVKAVFKDNPVELFTKGTGGSEFGFIRQRGLEDAVSRIGEELHSQYLISYNPSNKEEGGFHKLAVRIEGHPEYKVQTRPGYWLAVKQ